MPSRFRRDTLQPGSFSAKLVNLGQQPLLVVCDYEGTLATCGEGLEPASPHPRAPRALAAMIRHPKHQVAILTGLQDSQVDRLLDLPLLSIIGLHGLQWPGNHLPLPDSKSLEQIADQLSHIEGVRLVHKGWTLAAYYGDVPSSNMLKAVTHLGRVQLPQGWTFIQGNQVREYLPAGHGKAKAIERLVAEHPLHRVVFLAKDDTNEEAFGVLNRLGGTAIKVGSGLTQAAFRLGGPGDVMDLLEVWAQFV